MRFHVAFSPTSLCFCFETVMVMVDRGKAMREIEFIEAFPTDKDCGVDRNEPTAYMSRFGSWPLYAAPG